MFAFIGHTTEVGEMQEELMWKSTVSFWSTVSQSYLSLSFLIFRDICASCVAIPQPILSTPPEIVLRLPAKEGRDQ
jgi:hypothetical protein